MLFCGCFKATAIKSDGWCFVNAVLMCVGTLAVVISFAIGALSLRKPERRGDTLNLVVCRHDEDAAGGAVYGGELGCV